MAGVGRCGVERLFPGLLKVVLCSTKMSDAKKKTFQLSIDTTSFRASSQSAPCLRFEDIFCVLLSLSPFSVSSLQVHDCLPNELASRCNELFDPKQMTVTRFH